VRRTEGRLWRSTGVPDTPGAADVVTALRAHNAELKAENAELRAQITELAERVARLERLISRNSGEFVDAAEH
jgi:cell division protein FtsB